MFCSWIADRTPKLLKTITHDMRANILFKPFETTKGLTGMGIGAYESREYVRALGGDLTVSSQSGIGSLFVFKIPLAAGKTVADVPTTAEYAFE